METQISILTCHPEPICILLCGYHTIILKNKLFLRPVDRYINNSMYTQWALRVSNHITVFHIHDGLYVYTSITSTYTAADINILARYSAANEAFRPSKTLGNVTCSSWTSGLELYSYSWSLPVNSKSMEWLFICYNNCICVHEHTAFSTALFGILDKYLPSFWTLFNRVNACCCYLPCHSCPLKSLRNKRNCCYSDTTTNWYCISHNYYW